MNHNLKYEQQQALLGNTNTEIRKVWEQELLGTGGGGR